MSIPRCRMDTCRATGRPEPADWAWQPFGPHPTWSFAHLGRQNRSFPAIPVCEGCRQDIDHAGTEDGPVIRFRYKKTQYIVVPRTRFTRGQVVLDLAPKEKEAL